MKKSILILVLSDLKHDARVRRQINALKEQYQVTVVCFDAETNEGFEVIRLPPINLTLTKKAVSSFFLLAGLNAIAYRILHNYTNHVLRSIEGKTFDLVIANDVETLPVAFRIPGKPKVFFDAHEYAPRHFEDKLMWRIFFKRFNIWLCKKYIPLTSGMSTVGNFLAVEYEKYFGVKPVVITNANSYVDLQPAPIGNQRVRLVHHGIATPSRNLHLTIEMMGLLDERFTLDMYLLTPGFASSKTSGYLELLKRQAATNPRVKIHPPVKGDQIVSVLNKYDIGVFLLPPVNFNYLNTLPNKFFDFVQARLAVAIGPTPEMALLINRYDNGIVSSDFTPAQLASKLNALTAEEISRLKANSSRAAADLNAEKNQELLRKQIAEVLR